MITVAVIEDDPFLAKSLETTIVELGCKSVVSPDFSTLVRKLRGKIPAVVLVDLFIPAKTEASSRSKANSGGNGISALRQLKKKWPKVKAVLITGQASQDAKKWCDENDVDYALKPITRERLTRLLGLRRLKAFVVHGRDDKARKKVTKVLKAARIDSIILMEQANRGRTIIEKFEKISEECDCAVVIWTPDDFGGLGKPSSKTKTVFRARQNVVFELGYFYGALRRRSGLVLIVEFGDSEIPSDISGVIRLDGTVSEQKLLESIQAELVDLLT